MGIVCPACGYDNTPGLRFCARCATELANVCPACGFENPAGFKFCGQCGANLTAAQYKQATDDDLRRLQSYIPGHLVEKMARQSQDHKGERRTVTILFNDVSGFTSMSERLDPEEVYSIMDDLFKSFVEEVYRYEGTVDKFTGDGLMALFGAPVAHENDPERAVRAAMNMQAAVERLNQRITPRYGIRLQVRFGLNAGEVVVGGLGSDLRLDYTVMGDAVNVASRLEKAAEPGAVLVSESVFRATEPLFDFTPMGEIALKGRTAPVRTYKVAGEKELKGRTRGIRGLEAPMIGRDREFGQIKAATLQMLERGRGQIVLVTGEAGIGKSRVTAEWKTWLAGQSVRVLQSNSQSHTVSIGLWAFRDLLRNYFHLNEADSREATRNKVETKARELLGTAADDLAPFLENLLSPDLVAPAYAGRLVHLTPAELRQQTFLAMRDLFTAEASRQPLALIFEDTHWLDRPSLDLLLFLLGLIDNLPIIFYCISRADEGAALQEISALARTQFAGQIADVRLGPLSENDVDRLLNALLAIPNLPDALRASIPERAEGNPFFLEEIIRTMIDRGIIERDAGGYWRAGRPDVALLEVPRTLRGLILTRVDALPENPRQALQCASVIGRTFTRGLLAGVVETPISLDASLQALQEHGLIHVEPNGKELLFAFHHALTQEAVYGTLLTRRRQDLHRAVGDAIERLYAERIEEQIEFLAHHYYEADVPDRALHYLMRAGARSADRYANDAALEYYQHALGLMERAPTSPEERVTIHIGLGDVRGFRGEYEEALAQYQSALQLAAAPGAGLPARRLAAIERRAARAWERKGGYEEANARLEHALACLVNAADSEDQLEQARVYSDLGWVAFRQGEMEAAEAWTERALTTLEPSKSLQELSAAYNRLAGISHQRGDWSLAAHYAQRGLEIRERIGYTAGLAMSYNNLSVIHMGGGHWEEGIRYAEKSLELKQRIGDVGGVGISFNNLGVAYKDRGDLDRAREYLLKSLATAKRVKNANFLASALSNLGQTSLLSGNLADALGYYDESLKVATASGSREQMSETLWLLAEAWSGTDNLERAETYAEQALRLAEEIGSRAAGASAHRALAGIRRHQGRPAEAARLLEHVLEEFKSLRNEIEVGRTYAQLGLAQADLQDMDAAGASLRAAVDVFDRLGADRDGAEARRCLASIGQNAPKGPTS
jgi:class 3 adenylate cyclase/predicted ATPase